MNCRKARFYISAYYDEELSNSIKKELLTHVEICVSCQKELILVEQVRAGLKSFVQEELSDDFNDKLFARIYNAPRTEVTRVSNVPSVLAYRLRWLSPFIAAACVLVFAFWLSFNQLTSPDASKASYTNNTNSLIKTVNEKPPVIDNYRRQFYSPAGLAFSAAKLDSLKVAASLKDNHLLFNRLRLDATRNFGGYGNNTFKPVMQQTEPQTRFIYPVINNADVKKQHY